MRKIFFLPFITILCFCISITFLSGCDGGGGGGTTSTSTSNNPPTITSTPVTTATVDTAYSYDVNATDKDGDTLTYALTTKPIGMTINVTTGLISWTPSTDSSYDVTVSVLDGKGGTLQQSWTITVTTRGSSTSQKSKLAAGSSHACALLFDGTLKCWGDNFYGELGNGSTTNTNQSFTPVSVLNITNATAIAVGQDHTCTLLSNNTAKCWGWNYAGQLGNGNTFSYSVPVSVINLW